MWTLRASPAAPLSPRQPRPAEQTERTSDLAGNPRHEGTFFDQGIGTSIRVSLWSDGRARISQFDSQMSAEWTADFSPGVDDALTVAFLGAAERCMAPVPAETTDHHHQGEQDR